MCGNPVKKLECAVVYQVKALDYFDSVFGSLLNNGRCVAVALPDS